MPIEMQDLIWPGANRNGQANHIVRAVPYEQVHLALQAGRGIRRKDSGVNGAGMRRDAAKQGNQENPYKTAHGFLPVLHVFLTPFGGVTLNII
jgi:hypothetical protein